MNKPQHNSSQKVEVKHVAPEVEDVSEVKHVAPEVEDVSEVKDAALEQSAKEDATAEALTKQKVSQELQAKRDAEDLVIKQAEEAKALAEADNTPSKVSYRALMEAYKKQNPVKYALKEAEFKKKLAALK